MTSKKILYLTYIRGVVVVMTLAVPINSCIAIVPYGSGSLGNSPIGLCCRI